MDSKTLFTHALGLVSPWQLNDIRMHETDDGISELHLTISYEPGAIFSIDSEPGHVHDHTERTWRHLDFFQHKCYLHCRVPRSKLASGKTKLAAVPWARPGIGFTLLFEQYVLQLIRLEMPVNKAAESVREDPNRLWTILRHYVGQAYSELDHSQIQRVGIDVTSIRKGHDYITTLVDMATRKIAHVTSGKSKESVERLRKYLESKGTSASQIEQVCLDMSPSFIAGTLEQFPVAKLTFDRFHVKKLLNEAMDKVRRAERAEHDLLKGHKYTFLKGESKQSEKKEKQRDELLVLYPRIGHAYRLKILFDDFWDMENAEQAERFLDDWCAQVDQSTLAPFQKFVATLRAHWYGITNYTEPKMNNGILEGLNTKIQLAKRRARGFRNVDNLITMIYLIATDISLGSPHRLAQSLN